METAHTLKERLANLAIDDLPSVPALAPRILEVTARPSATLQDLEAVLILDPALTIKVLRLANNPLSDTTGRIADMRHALARIEPPLAKLMALSFNVSPCLSSRGFDYLGFWRRSGAMAIVAPRLARHFPDVAIDEAQVAGLLAPIGQLLLAELLGAEYSKLCADAKEKGVALDELERQQLGADHAELAGYVIAAWNLPESIAKAVEVHLRPGSIERVERHAKELAKVLHLAALVVDLLVFESADRADIIQVWLEVWANLESDACDMFLDVLRGELEAIDRTYSLKIENLTEVLFEARKQMLQVCLATATNLTVIARQAEASRKQVEDLQRQRDWLEQQATTDALTGIGNRKFFDGRFEEEIKRCQRAKSSLSLIMFDLDRFKDLNDTYGHQAGDEVLRAVTSTVRTCLRISDVVARYGGEEFVVIAPDTDTEGAVASAERMRKRIEKLRTSYNGLELQITASFGVATVTNSERLATSQELIQQADQCLYEAKHAGRNCVRSMVL